MLYDDTIAAIATPPGAGGVGVVRVSGREALPILERMFVPARPGHWCPFRLRYGHVVAPGGETVDEALAAFFRGPHSFTAEDVAEISCHGGPLVLQQVLGLALQHGARLATPGEFTMRAFLNGRLDLTQVEATLDIINARTNAALALAQQQLAGWLSQELRRVREALLGALAYCTALVDFPEDEIDPQEVAAPVTEALRTVERLQASADQGIVYRQGARAAIVGLPNAGKSSLLNALLRADRAIVTPVPGTTRDTLEETANLCGVPVVLVDTAGITETADPIERIGVGRSRQALAAADLVLLVVDITQPVGDAERAVAALTEGKPTVLVWNKVDLLPTNDERRTTNDERRTTNDERRTTNDERRTTGDGRRTTAGERWPMDNGVSLRDEPFAATVAVSALTGEGLEALAHAVAGLLLGGEVAADGQLVTNPRHRDALGRAAGHLRDALAGHARGVPADLLAVDLTAALSALGEITGETVGEDLLDTIFSRFCIGK
ncbi:MAG TPA: tRNA uridine-5-carboxymethylaminomethyl(34) synthesis GTPase MnmE [Roseiflexaceae bacterium]|nr:tRNA uridine-5-carboxymethylaminomethyl(34) synthesis GTPase MnmE [Roseiflexaceae bacterium]